MESTWAESPYEDANDWIVRSAMPFGTAVAYSILRTQDREYSMGESSGVTGLWLAEAKDKTFDWTKPPPTIPGTHPWERIMNQQTIPPKPYYATCIKNKAKDARRKERRYTDRHLSGTPKADRAIVTKEDRNDGVTPLTAEHTACLEKAWCNLIEPGKTFLYEQHVLGLTQLEIAERHDVQRSYVNSNCRSARVELSQHYFKCLNGDNNV